MKDQPPGENVQQQSSEQGTNIPPPPNNETGTDTQREGDTSTQSQITDLKGEIRSAEKWMIWLTGAIAALALCTVVVGILQWNAMSGQLDQMKSGAAATTTLASAAQTQATNTTTLATQAITQANAAKSAAKTAADALTLTQNSQRAWIGVDGPLHVDLLNFPTPPSRFAVAGSYRIKNYGETPAIKVVTVGWFESDSGAPPAKITLQEEVARTMDFACQSAKQFSEGTVPVAGTLKQPPALGKMLVPGGSFSEHIGTIDAPWGGDFVSSPHWFEFFGCIAYQDGFGRERQTRFCFDSTNTLMNGIPIRQGADLEQCNHWNDEK